MDSTPNYLAGIVITSIVLLALIELGFRGVGK